MMRPDFDPLDHLLADDAAATDIVPSSGFTGAVMDAVKRSRTAPPPIPFPWRRVGPWLAAAVILVAIGAVGLLRLPAASSDFTLTMPAIVHDALAVLATPESWSLVAGVLLALASTILALRSGQLFQRR
jgi:hypothetical protein